MGAGKRERAGTLAAWLCSVWVMSGLGLRVKQKEEEEDPDGTLQEKVQAGGAAWPDDLMHAYMACGRRCWKVVSCD